MSHRRLKLYTASCVGWCIAMAANKGLAVPAVSRTFNGPDKAWQIMASSVPAQILAQECLPGGYRDTNGFERIVVAAPAGQSVLFACPIERVAVLDELQIRLAVKAVRPDIQLAARVVLPRSLDAQKRGPATAIVRGTSYNHPGNWQELRLDRVPKLLAEQTRVMRATPGAAIDSREAFVDAVVLIVPGNPRGIEIGTDELEVDGILLSASQSAAQPSINQSARASTSLPRIEAAGNKSELGIRDSSTPAVNASAVRLQGMTLLVDGKPFLPRLIHWRGESLQFLSNCGFNVVQLRTAPTAEQSADAERLGLWFVCAPEHPDALTRAGLGRANDRVLAWHLQDEALEVDPNYAMRWAELVREKDAVFGRPVVITPQSNWAAVSKAADIFIARHSRVGSLAPGEFQPWLEVCPQKARPGTPLWVSLATQGDEATHRQVAALVRGTAPSPSVDPRHLESCVQIACAHGAKGFAFQSVSSLSETDEPTRRRAARLQIINRRLQLLEPWLAGGKVVGQVASSDGNQIGVLLHVDRARLLMPIPNENANQINAAREKTRSASNELVFTVPGVPETSQIFYLSPATLRSLSSQRIAGGTKLAIPRSGQGFVLMTEDPQVIQGLRHRVARDGPKTVQLKRDLAVQQARIVAYRSQKLTPLGYNAELAARDATLVNQQLGQLDALITSGRIDQAHEVAAGILQQLERSAGEQRRAVAGAAILESNPLAVSSDLLSDFASLQQSLLSMRPGENLIAGGDFEDLSEMTQLGWQHVANPAADARSAAQLSAVEPKHGRYCLELSANAGAGMSQAPANHLVWIVSPPVAIDQNKVVEISGWVRVDKPFVAGEGLEVVDSLGGPKLALAVGQTSGWQPFRMIRATTEPTYLRLTFSLTGPGTAKVDAVMVRTLNQPIARRLPSVPPAGPSTAVGTTTPSR